MSEFTDNAWLLSETSEPLVPESEKYSEIIILHFKCATKTLGEEYPKIWMPNVWSENTRVFLQNEGKIYAVP